MQRAVKMTKGRIYRVVLVSDFDIGSARSFTLDEEAGQFVAKRITPTYLRRQIVGLRNGLEKAKRELHRLSSRLLSPFTSKRRQELESEISNLETGLRQALQREQERPREGWYCISFNISHKRLSDYRVRMTAYMKQRVFEKAQAFQREEPLYLVTYVPKEASKDKVEGKFWWYRDEFWVSVGYSEEEARLFLWEKGRREQRKFERLAKAKAAAKEAHEEVGRERIPEEVRLLVWERDGGCCVRCGSTDGLEFDHIIPVSKGGSNTEKNVQLLCARCNREKGDRLA